MPLNQVEGHGDTHFQRQWERTLIPVFTPGFPSELKASDYFHYWPKKGILQMIQTDEEADTKFT